MELPHIGKCCTKKGCQQLDFLPVICKHCRHVFCSLHASITEHSCSYERKTNDRQQEGINMVPISFYTKPSRDAPNHSSKLQKNILSTEQIQALTTLKHTSSTTGGSPSALKHKVRISPKIELMRLKARATGNGSIDVVDRFYLSVMWKGKSAPVYINRNALVGSSAMQFARNLHLSTLPGNIYRLKPLNADDTLPSNKTFNELLADTGDLTSSSNPELFNGCSLELVCFIAPKSE
ncbi:hypothetical protein COEREDRAFT_13800 [Coemansia reversa NRRL 1564]|uniref:AN1-type domain-containing protein n=1 Tax=Coemansia reversa (strain ATCC 12441 / NRRL 1564) TaxID=763665 RepID=A0A2G5BID3_COERN|nr:hypothetical protein COEREDRAFT_13800 [Coemansia reversa NRRL 1564]|eukprot:PIA18755.1 hypothetical protein COEREDRAFT_13800 [Coemansia reversa NRRL 1564]